MIDRYDIINPGLGGLLLGGIGELIARNPDLLLTPETVAAVAELLADLQALPPSLITLVPAGVFIGLSVAYNLISGDRPPTGEPGNHDWGSGGNLTRDEVKVRDKNKAIHGSNQTLGRR